eukprot:TRINITY_DN12432_c0_g1_i1.p1 TRINITY_DN12432_c0_g1~~TRINITY_DN12432_c0_g1_i1.p1  ORF type:complete len:873 (+),score=198.86 TRINITY_DN12432_c0_g1_i1:143-2761(+)
MSATVRLATAGLWDTEDRDVHLSRTVGAESPTRNSVRDSPFRRAAQGRDPPVSPLPASVVRSPSNEMGRFASGASSHGSPLRSRASRPPTAGSPSTAAASPRKEAAASDCDAWSKLARVAEEEVTAGSASSEARAEEEEEEDDDELLAVVEEGDMPALCPFCDAELNVAVRLEWLAEAPRRASGGDAAQGGMDATAMGMSGHTAHNPYGDGEAGSTAGDTPPPKTRQEKMWACLEVGACESEPYATASRVSAGVGLVFILVSVVNFAVESYPQFHDERAPASLFIIEATCIGFFTVELLCRTIAAPDKKEFFRDHFTIIDILSILPFYAGLAAGGGAAKGLLIVRLLRLMRIFRVFKVSKYSEAVQVVMGAMHRSTEGLYLLLFLILLSTMVFSSAMYFAERESSHYDPDTERWYIEWNSTYGAAGSVKSPYQSIVHTFWWCLVTLTTVGYGDEVPTSIGGKFVACVTMLAGTLVIAFPMIIIGQKFQDMYSQHLEATRKRPRGLFAVRRKNKRRDSMVSAASNKGMRANSANSAAPLPRRHADSVVPPSSGAMDNDSAHPVAQSRRVSEVTDDTVGGVPGAVSVLHSTVPAASATDPLGQRSDTQASLQAKRLSGSPRRTSVMRVRRQSTTAGVAGSAALSSTQRLPRLGSTELSGADSGGAMEDADEQPHMSATMPPRRSTLPLAAHSPRRTNTAGESMSDDPAAPKRTSGLSGSAKQLPVRQSSLTLVRERPQGLDPATVAALAALPAALNDLASVLRQVDAPRIARRLSAVEKRLAALEQGSSTPSPQPRQQQQPAGSPRSPAEGIAGHPSSVSSLQRPPLRRRRSFAGVSGPAAAAGSPPHPASAGTPLAPPPADTGAGPAQQRHPG